MLYSKPPKDEPPGRIYPMRREDHTHRIETHVAGICVRKKRKSDFEILIAKRKEDRDIFPGKWECGGGQVHPGETFEDAIIRQFSEEFGIIIKNPFLVDTYSIPNHKDRRLIPGVRFICPFDKFKNKRFNLNKNEFSEYKWTQIDKLKEIDFIPELGRSFENIIQNHRVTILTLLGIYF